MNIHLLHVALLYAEHNMKYLIHLFRILHIFKKSV
jgi:hypothetical protein